VGYGVVIHCLDHTDECGTGTSSSLRPEPNFPRDTRPVIPNPPAIMSHPSPTRPGRTVSLTPQLNEFGDCQVARGRHQSAGEVIRETLRRAEAERQAEAACLDMIHGIARAGRSAIERGDFIAIETEQARDDLFRRLTGRTPPGVQPGSRIAWDAGAAS
jgi:putative addiction module CopG family antidote